MKNIQLFLFLLTIILQSYAQFSEDFYNPIDKFTAGVKSINRQYTSIEESGFSKLTIFKYDNKNKIERRTEYNGSDLNKINGYTVYIYGKSGYLSKKCVYVKNHYYPYDTIFYSSTNYYYQNGFLISEKEIYHSLHSTPSEVKYEYTNRLLTSLTFYLHGNLNYKSVFKYENNRIVSEALYTEKGEGKNAKNYIYNKNTLSEVSFCNFGGIPYKTAHYSYNKDGKISIVNLLINSAYSCGSSFFEKYEY
jgi:hypothetical protein